ncbi:MAG TPA: NAD(P)/FAD-dependent oxidoreductase [Ilumatobacteraceae bacterium]|nr:NAD(P)/FAD-dependent oxidoreductase [Ilumatobacteraceae bacterium]
MVIVGGGFGGLAAARQLADAPVRITLIDRRNHHLFQPLLYQVATAGLNPSDIAAPIRSLLADQPNVRVLLGEVVGIEDDAVALDDGTSIGFDHLVLAAGTTHSYFGHDEWETHAPGLKTIEDALEIRRRILSAFEHAERSDDPAEREAQLTFVVVGGGPTGVEMAGAIAEIAFQTMTREFRTIDSTTARVILLEATDRILSTYPNRLSESALRQLGDLGVDVRLGEMVTAVDEHSVETTTGSIPTRTVVWGAGNEASPLATLLGAPTDRAGRVEVESDLSVPGRPNVFAIGDMAHAVSGGATVPGVAQGAKQGGAHVANAIRADLAGSARPEFRYDNKGELATIGRSSAVGVIRGVQLSGWTAWMAWWSAHIVFLIDFRSRLLVFINWAWNYLTFRRGARLITGPWQPRSASLQRGSDP